ncbi:MAG: glucanase, partial [Fidelibacterota bacterium]
HANREKEKTERSVKNMHIRVDELVHSRDDVKKMGIGIGDIICVDPKYVETESGFIKSRFLDNKAGCFVLWEIARKLREKKRNLPVELFFSNYEEVGHGGTVGYSPTIRELLVIDMGVLGDDCEGRETSCSICAKDSSGPYDYEFRRTLVNLARDRKIDHVVDVYPYYSSDGSTALTAGNDFRVGLIGMGVAASHGTERTHRRGIQATIDLALAYIQHVEQV